MRSTHRAYSMGPRCIPHATRTPRSSLPFCALPSKLRLWLVRVQAVWPACDVATWLGRSVPLCHVTRIVVPFFTRWVGRPSFRAHTGHSAAKISFSSASCCAPRCASLRRFKLIVRPREHRSSFVRLPRVYSFHEYFSSIFFHGHRKEDLIFIR